MASGLKIAGPMYEERCGLGNRGNWVWLPAGQEKFLRNAHIVSGAHPAVGSVGVRVSFSGGKETAARSWPFSGEVANERCTYTPPTRCHVVYYENFTLSIISFLVLAPVTGCQSLFVIFAGLLPSQVLHSPACPRFPLFPQLNFEPSSSFSFSFLQQVNIRLGHMLPPMHNTCPYHFNLLFSILSGNVCVIPIFI